MFEAGEEGAPTAAQFRCMFQNASDETIMKLFRMGGDGGAGQMPPPDVLEVIVKCGLDTGQGDGGGSQGPSPEQLQCVTSAIGVTALSEIISGSRAPTAEEMQKLQACGFSFGQEPTGTPGGPPQLTQEQQRCLVAAIGEKAFAELMGSQRAPTLEEVAKIKQKTPVPTPTPTPSMHSSRLIAERFLQKTPTFVFDGLPASLTLKNVERCEPMETCFTFVFNFKSTHPGYGDRGGQVLAQVLTEHEARVTTEQERITRVILDGKWDEQAQRYLPGMGP
jgi:hypothetical protein